MAKHPFLDTFYCARLIGVIEELGTVGALAGTKNMSERNQVVTAAMVMGNSVDWDRFDPQVVIDAVNTKRFGPALTRWIVNKGWLPPCPIPLFIGRSVPVHELGPMYPVWRGPVHGNGFEGDPDQDPRSIRITTFDTRKTVIITGLEGTEIMVTGEERRRIIRSGPITPIDFHVGWNLIRENGQKHLRSLHEVHGVQWIETDTVLRDPDGCRRSLTFSRRDDGDWVWHCTLLGSGRSARCPALGLASSKG